MRFVVFVKASAETEAGVMPSEQLLTKMTKFNEELVKAGSCRRVRVCIRARKGSASSSTARKRTVIDGPFAETKELVAGSGFGSASRRRRRSSG